MAEIATLNENGDWSCLPDLSLRHPLMDTYNLTSAGPIDIMAHDEYEAVCATHYAMVSEAYQRNRKTDISKMKHFQMLEKCDLETTKEGRPNHIVSLRKEDVHDEVRHVMDIFQLPLVNLTRLFGKKNFMLIVCAYNAFHRLPRPSQLALYVAMNTYSIMETVFLVCTTSGHHSSHEGHPKIWSCTTSNEKCLKLVTCLILLLTLDEDEETYNLVNLKRTWRMEKCFAMAGA